MKNNSDLQSTYEKHIYNIKKEFETYQVVEFFLNSGNVAETNKTTNLDVLESAPERKKLILKFLRENLGSIEDIECTF